MSGCVFMDTTCPKCGRRCGNGGSGPCRCSCGWVGNDVTEEMERLFEEEFPEENQHKKET